MSLTKWGAIVATVALSCVPNAASDGTVLPVGTEDLPELPDREGDVETLPTWTGDNDLVDLTAAWVDHDPATDVITFTIRVANAETLKTTPPGHDVLCTFEGNATIGDEVRGVLAVTWIEFQNHSDTHHAARLIRPNGNEVLKHSFTAEATKPGYFRFGIARADLLKLADEFRDPKGHCSGIVPIPDTPYSSGSAGPIDAADSATSSAVYSFMELRQAVNAAGEPLDPIEGFERHNATASPTTSSAEEVADRTPAAGLAAVVIAMAVTVFATRRRQ
ncbi:MAG TPA: hypothetical protein VGB18_04385 [Candidatus Thermoplasmatota archaeon]